MQWEPWPCWVVGPWRSCANHRSLHRSTAVKGKKVSQKSPTKTQLCSPLQLTCSQNSSGFRTGILSNCSQLWWKLRDQLERWLRRIWAGWQVVSRSVPLWEKWPKCTLWLSWLRSGSCGSGRSASGCKWSMSWWTHSRRTWYPWDAPFQHQLLDQSCQSSNWRDRSRIRGSSWGRNRSKSRACSNSCNWPGIGKSSSLRKALCNLYRIPRMMSTGLDYGIDRVRYYY